MPPLETRLRTRATANICALYPVWQQSKLNRRGTPEELAALEAWEDANVNHMNRLLKQADAGYEIDPDADWPDPEAWEAPEYTAPEMPKADGETVHGFDVEKLPENIRDELERSNTPHGQEQDWLRNKYNEITNGMFLDPGRYSKLQEQMQRAMYEGRKGAVEVI
jgi:hypothetical protein